LVLADSHESSVLDIEPGQETGPPKMSMRCPSATLTIARLVSMRLPQPKRVRFRLPGRLSVLTLVTLTLKTFSTAILISVLLESLWTKKVYLFSSSSAYDFSLTIGAIQTSRWSLKMPVICHPPRWSRRPARLPPHL